MACNNKSRTPVPPVTVSSSSVPFMRIMTTTTTSTTTTASSPAPHNHHHQHQDSHHSHHSSSRCNTSSSSSNNNTSSHSHPSHRHYHLPSHHPSTLTPDSFDDSSSSSLSSTPSSATIVTSSSSSSTSDDLIPGRIELPVASKQNQGQQNASSKNRSRSSSSRRKSQQQLNCQQMNDLNVVASNNQMTGTPSSSSSNRRSSRKAGSDCPAVDRNSSPAFHGENWTTFHFGPQNVVTTSAGPTRSEMNGRLSPRCESEHYGSLEQRIRTSTLGSGVSGTTSTTSTGTRISNGKAVAVIKGTASSTSSRLSSNSFNGSSSDWKKHLHSHEIRKLRRELDQSEEKVSSLTSQLTTHSHMVTAFEQSLASMSLRLQQMTSMSAQKDSEIQRLQIRIEELKGTAGCGGKGQMDERRSRTPSSPSMQHQVKSCDSTTGTSHTCGGKKSDKSHTSCSSATAVSPAGKEGDKSSESKHRRNSSSGANGNHSLLIRRHTFVSPLNPDQQETSVKDNNSSRWFKAFRRSSVSKKQSSVSSSAGSDRESSTAPPEQGFRYTDRSRTSSIDSFSRIDGSTVDPELVMELKKQLHEKEKTVTDLRLEALTSAHQLQSLEELVTQLRTEVGVLRAENERLTRSSHPVNGVTVNHRSQSSAGMEWPASSAALSSCGSGGSEETTGYASITSVYFGSSS